MPETSITDTDKVRIFDSVKSDIDSSIKSIEDAVNDKNTPINIQREFKIELFYLKQIQEKLSGV